MTVIGHFPAPPPVYRCSRCGKEIAIRAFVTPVLIGDRTGVLCMGCTGGLTAYMEGRDLWGADE